MIYRESFTFTVKKGGGDQPNRPYILFEPKGADIPQLRGMMITLELRPGTTYDEAKALCALMQTKVLDLVIQPAPT
ncbi:hypothetical protein [Falsiroseomonas sp. E2-1-a20]|uniref:hypothetical protein n=1 Tax=Falsiroseomonas sp. E2-1-a20 TaxID=3239300 RepID=UPI003F40A4EC